MSADSFGFYSGGRGGRVLLAYSWQRPGMLLKILYCTEQPSQPNILQSLMSVVQTLRNLGVDGASISLYLRITAMSEPPLLAGTEHELEWKTKLRCTEPMTSARCLLRQHKLLTPASILTQWWVRLLSFYKSGI